jgi:DUF1680 family protein
MGAFVPSLMRIKALSACVCALLAAASNCPAQPTPATAAQLPPLSSVRLLESPFTAAVAANRSYLLALDPDRLLSPFLRESGLQTRKPPYKNWESSGLDGHTAGHYLTALANMIASGADAPDGELQRRLNYMVTELARCQTAAGDGYVGGIPGGRAFWKDLSTGHIDANGFGINGKWVPWYNLHKTFAGLRDAWLVAGNTEAREVLIKLGDWCERATSGLTEAQMQTMLRAEHGGMCEVLADLYAISGDAKYLTLARRFIHHAVVDPLRRHEDRLTGLHANTQIPKVIGLQRIATLTGDREFGSAAHFFWQTVSRDRSVAFGGNSVSEHFNDPKNFGPMLESREGPETCNTYNMLHLTELLFSSNPEAAYADVYERALFNHILSAIHPDVPGYVYFTPVRPEHYRVYSQPDHGFWCCVGTGMENPGKYAQFIYARAPKAIFVNLFIASEYSAPDLGLTLRQETKFPDEGRAQLRLHLKQPSTFSLHLRHPAWVLEKDFAVRVNGKRVNATSRPSSYLEVRRKWRDGDRVELELPMHTTAEQLPDGSHWVAFTHGPILLASPCGTNALTGLRANDSRMGHVAAGPLVPLDKVPVLLATKEQLPGHIVPDRGSSPLHFRLVDVAEPPAAQGLPLVPFFRLHDQRYTLYWQLMTRTELAAQREQLAAAEHARAVRETATLDSVAIGEQQPEVEHEFAGEGSRTGTFQERRWRDGKWLQYTLNAREEKAVDLAITYWCGDDARVFDIHANGRLLATERLNRSRPGKFFEVRYPIPSEVLAATTSGRITIKLVSQTGLIARVFDLRLMRRETSHE